MNGLALQIGEFHRVEIYQGQSSHPGGGKIQAGGRAKATESDDNSVTLQEFLLAFKVNLRHEDLAAVALELVVVHGFKNGLATEDTEFAED